MGGDMFEGLERAWTVIKGLIVFLVVLLIGAIIWGYLGWTR
jgi:hypothetical protein